MRPAEVVGEGSTVVPTTIEWAELLTVDAQETTGKSGPSRARAVIATVTPST
jgi:hypothetical protein